ncbi:MAG TPA: hypothetical protein VI756_31265 [Blastocatellia bacterium]
MNKNSLRPFGTYFMLVLFALAITGVANRATANTPAGDDPGSAPACSAAEYHAFDFTLGDWSVSDSAGNAVGISQIRYDLDGCVVVENWAAPGGSPSGRNLDGFNQEDQRWRRYFADTRGHVHVFEGVSKGDSIEYQGTSRGPKGEQVLNRLTIRKDGVDRMTQLWRKSTDNGKTWEPAFEGIFTRIKHQ